MPRIGTCLFLLMLFIVGHGIHLVGHRALAKECDAASVGSRLPCRPSGFPCWECRSVQGQFLWERRKSVFGAIAVVTLMTPPEEKAYNDWETYKEVSNISLPLFASYSHEWSYHFLVYNHTAETQPRTPASTAGKSARANFHIHSGGTQDHGDAQHAADLVNVQVQPYWRKIDALKTALSIVPPPAWVLYSDVDVLLLNATQPLEAFIHGHDDKLLVGVGECTAPDVVRSGFFLLKNDHRTLKFLNDWQSRFMTFVHAENPDQLALEDVVSSATWRTSVFLHHWRDFHSYDVCPKWMSSFSVHFPGPFKVIRMARSSLWQEFTTVGTSNLRSPAVDALRILRRGLTHAAVDPSALDSAHQCFDEQHAGMTPTISNLMATCADLHSAHQRQLEKVLHLPESLVSAWWPLNSKSMLVYSYTIDEIQQIAEMLFHFDLAPLWSSRFSNEIRLGLWKFTILFLVGGYVVDSNEPSFDLIKWDAKLSDQLLVGLGDGSLGSMPWNSAISLALDQIQERVRSYCYATSPDDSDLQKILSILGGEDFKTQVVQQYSCYANACSETPRDIFRHISLTKRQAPPSCNLTCPTGPLFAETTEVEPCSQAVDVCAFCMTGLAEPFDYFQNGNLVGTVPYPGIDEVCLTMNFFVGTTPVTVCGQISLECRFLDVVVSDGPGIGCILATE